MRSTLVFALAGAVAVVLQTSLLRHLPFLPSGPDLILVLCVYLGLHFHSVGGVLGAFLLGYLLDTFGSMAPGLYCLTMTLVFTVVYLMSTRLWMENPVSNIAAVGLGSIVKIVVVVTFLAVTSGFEANWLRTAQSLGFEAMLAMLLTPMAFAALQSSLASPRAG